MQEIITLDYGSGGLKTAQLIDRILVPAFANTALCQLRPRYAVISVSDDRTDDCPSRKILRLLSQLGVECFFTDAVPCQHTQAQPHLAIRFQIEEGALKVLNV